MNIIPIQNFFKYGTTNLKYQVDPVEVKPIFEEEFKNSNLCGQAEYLRLWKLKRNDLRFHYSTGHPYSDRPGKDAFAVGMIYAQEPRWDFHQVDVESLMVVEMLHPDKQGEIFDVLNNIARRLDLERVIAAEGVLGPYEYDNQFSEMGKDRAFFKARKSA